MGKSPFCRILGMAAWLLSSIGAINWGLEAAGRDIFMMPVFQTTLMGAVMPLKYAIGAAGLVSFVMFCMACTTGSCGCGPSCNGSC